MIIRNKKWISIDRAINEFRSGRPIIISNKKDSWIFFTLEHINIKFLLYISRKSLTQIYSYITNKKARSMYGNSFSHNSCISMRFIKSDIKWLKAIHTNNLTISGKTKGKKELLTKNPKFIDDVINLAKNAKMIPCLIGCKINYKFLKNYYLNFNYNEINSQHKFIAESTKFISESRMPIKKDHEAKIMIFKSYVGGLEHVAIKIGSPSIKNSINVRIQSVCLTGEVFHSMKCDCYQQLHQSIDYLINNKGGYIIHLEQEGRGIGLANKIKAYDLQYKGMDTFNADIAMGFLGDERDFTIATKILKYLKVKKVNLITNNKDKIKALIKNKIKINKQVPTFASQNKFNIEYLTTRAKKMNYKTNFKRNF